MKRMFVLLMTGLVSAALLSGPTTTAHADEIDNANPLKWKTTSTTKCTSKYKPKVKKGIVLTSSQSKARSAKSWGPDIVAAAGNLKTTRFYENFPLKVDRFIACYKGKVRTSYYPTQYKRYHKSINFKKGGGSAWIPTFSVRTPSSGFSKCYRGYLHPKTTKKMSSCNGYDIDFS